MAYLRRREFIGLIGGAAAWPMPVRAQRSTKIARIGFLVTGELGSAEQRVSLDQFRRGLRERGYVEGENILIEYRSAGGRIERFPELARELVSLDLDLLVASNTPAALAAKEATTTLPIVVPVMGDPVGDGIVESLSRPGGNITGLTFLGPEIVPKRLELLKQALPTLSHVAALWHPGAYGPDTMEEMKSRLQAAAQTLSVQLQLVEVRRTADFEPAFLAMRTARAEGVIILPSSMLFNERRPLIDLAARHLLPSIAMSREFPDAGGLMSYGAGISELFRSSVAYVDLVLRGTKPADLPIQQPTKFELVINLKTAKALNLSIPPSLLAIADEVIE
jgi:putative ABC transport system substrate-binding protein